MTFGTYLVVEQIGAGGMAQVYRALDPALGRSVAIKVLPPHLASDPEFVTRFRREASIVGTLLHPNILPVYMYGEQDGMLYIVMAYVPGGTLEELIESTLPERFELTRILQIIGPVLDALDYAHKQGIVHRDLKPANILISPSGSPLVADFGIARLVMESRQTRAGLAMGTPQYMSPEQGLGQEVDGRSDIYSLGIILFQLLCGTVPFNGETSFAIIHQHIYEPLPALEPLRPGMPPDIELVVRKATAKRPADRYQFAGDLRQDLEDAIHEARRAQGLSGKTVVGNVPASALETNIEMPLVPRPPVPMPPTMAASAAGTPVPAGPESGGSADFDPLSTAPELDEEDREILASGGLNPNNSVFSEMRFGQTQSRASGAARKKLIVGIAAAVAALLCLGIAGSGAAATFLLRAPTATATRPAQASSVSTSTPAASGTAAPVVQPPSSLPQPPASPTNQSVNPEDEVWAAAQHSNEVWAQALKVVDTTHLAEAYGARRSTTSRLRSSA
jgi:serine/threonine protein kinase